jgi:hypothetical protein
MRKGMMKGSGKRGYYNIIGKDPMVHSQSAKGICQPQRLPNIMKKATPTTPKMAVKLEDYMKKLSKSLRAEPLYRIDVLDERRISLATDGDIYDAIYDPSMSEEPYLYREIFEEMNVPQEKRKVPNVYRFQEEFRKFLQQNGYDYELEGGGILRIYKDTL